MKYEIPDEWYDKVIESLTEDGEEEKAEWVRKLKENHEYRKFDNIMFELKWRGLNKYQRNPKHVIDIRLHDKSQAWQEHIVCEMRKLAIRTGGVCYECNRDSLGGRIIEIVSPERLIHDDKTDKLLFEILLGGKFVGEPEFFTTTGNVELLNPCKDNLCGESLQTLKEFKEIINK